MTGKASGDGDLVGEAGNGDGDGVRANGDNGMWPTDFRRFDELFETFPVVTPLPLPEGYPASKQFHEMSHQKINIPFSFSDYIQIVNNTYHVVYAWVRAVLMAATECDDDGDGINEMMLPENCKNKERDLN